MCQDAMINAGPVHQVRHSDPGALMALEFSLGHSQLTCGVRGRGGRGGGERRGGMEATVALGGVQGDSAREKGHCLPAGAGMAVWLLDSSRRSSIQSSPSMIFRRFLIPPLITRRSRMPADAALLDVTKAGARAPAAPALGPGLVELVLGGALAGRKGGKGGQGFVAARLFLSCTSWAARWVIRA